MGHELLRIGRSQERPVAEWTCPIPTCEWVLADTIAPRCPQHDIRMVHADEEEA